MAVLLERAVRDARLRLPAIPFLNQQLGLLLKLLELDLGSLSASELELLDHLVDVLPAKLFSAHHPLELGVYLVHLLPCEREPPCQLLDLLEASSMRGGVMGRLLIGWRQGICFLVLSYCISLLVVLSTEVGLVTLSRGELVVRRKGPRRENTCLCKRIRRYRS